MGIGVEAELVASSCPAQCGIQPGIPGTTDWVWILDTSHELLSKSLPLSWLWFSQPESWLYGVVHRCRLICKKHLTYFPVHSQLCWREALPTAIVYICLSKPLFQFPGYQPAWRTWWKQQDHTPKPLVGWEAVHPNEHPISSTQPPIAGLWLQPHFVTWVWASLNVASWWQKSCQFTL